jgi:hypothetical protein
LILAYRKEARFPDSFSGPDVTTILTEAGMWHTRAAEVLFGSRATAKVVFWTEGDSSIESSTYHGLFHVLKPEFFAQITAFCYNQHDIHWDGIQRQVGGVGSLCVDSLN